MPVQDGVRKRCLVAIDTATGPLLIELELAKAATIEEALRQARETLQAAEGIDWDGAATGIWGERRDRGVVPRDGDRIEMYRALSADPRAQRRARARSRQR